ncbi:ArsR/SmtB family transcription factor [Paenibacillus sp. GCM10012307]|uniref:Helix-turn-helix transcriptional regulator n=1 Tax=Paenibacillus roseus TaxID=2798579 RepID=A0A934J8U6_9BACL|nr:metalloregulator ArsR/SmtB family transcription factor [Paenibacillus roseus]MBJ6362557.1 helix-turn-helix transcriptional regulator [Paenibacillus roseus]
MSQAAQIRDVFDAIADPTRRRLIHLLSDVDELPLHEITMHFPMGRTAVSKHLTILKKASLVHDRRVGRETRYKLNASPLKAVEDWVAFYSKYWNNNMMRLGRLLEEDAE